MVELADDLGVAAHGAEETVQVLGNTPRVLDRVPLLPSVLADVGQRRGLERGTGRKAAVGAPSREVTGGRVEEMAPVPRARRERGRGCGVAQRRRQLGDRGVVDRILESLGAADRVVERRLVAAVHLDPALGEVLVEILARDIPAETGTDGGRTLDHGAQRFGCVEVPHAERVRVGQDRIGGVAVDLVAVVVGECPLRQEPALLVVGQQRVHHVARLVRHDE